LLGPLLFPELAGRQENIYPQSLLVLDKAEAQQNNHRSCTGGLETAVLIKDRKKR